MDDLQPRQMSWVAKGTKLHPALAEFPNTYQAQLLWAVHCPGPLAERG